MFYFLVLWQHQFNLTCGMKSFFFPFQFIFITPTSQRIISMAQLMRLTENIKLVAQNDFLFFFDIIYAIIFFMILNRFDLGI